MIPKSRVRLFTFGLFAMTSIVAAAACVDLFHGTDFPTLCDEDAAACADDTGPAADVDVPDRTEAGEPIDLCAGTTADARRRAEHACGYLGACLGPLDDTRFGECMVRALAAYDCSFNPSLRPRGETAALWNCLGRASTCEAVALCVFGTPAPGCRPEDGLYTACNLERDDAGNLDAGTVLVACSDSTLAVGMNPCALRGRRCATVDEGKSICAGGRGASCTGMQRCEGSFAVQCKSAGGIDADEGTDCALFGDGRCVRDDAGVACAPAATAASCKGTSSVVCSDAGAAESCVGGSTVKIDCAAIGQGCSANGVSPLDPLLACKPVDAGAPCTETEDECSGGTLVSCVRGVRYTLRCANVSGLGPCTKPTGQRAACAAP